MIIGHQRVLDFLKKSVDKKRIAHAYLFAGSAHLGKKTVALEFIKTLVGQELKGINPDVLIVEPEIVEKDGVKKELEIGISEARKIQHQMSLYPYSLPYKITLVDGIEKMTPEASNCLLKTLEEPTGKAVLILITSNPRMLLPTIVSRCQIVNFLPVASREIEKGLKSKGDIKQIIRLANGRPGLAIEYLENPELLKRENEIVSRLEKILRDDLNERYQYAEDISKNIPLARSILNTWLFWFRDLILLNSGCPDLILYPGSVNYQKSYSILKLKEIIKTIKKTDWLLANPSINARLALEVLMLKI
ncbi:MAG: hypothetical protein ABH889_00135 [Candidatus Portnoybacteria bacterium]